jgi:glycosyltransferase involved in cell wall biosynthesis
VLNNSYDNSPEHIADSPLVSVGIPTYNRPEGLRRTLDCITGQTYKNLEIIVSDNCSSGPETEAVVREFIVNDNRIQYYRQETNKGAAFNFSFVLEKATGKYFMWAADDDEWKGEFIEECVKIIPPEGSACTYFNVIRRYNSTIQKYSLPELSSNHPRYLNLKNFLLNMQSPMIYGIHTRKSILWVIDEEMFDFYDCYFVFRILCQYSFNISDEELFSQGSDSPNGNKPFKPSKKYLFQYFPFFWNSTKTLMHSKINCGEKIRIQILLIYVTLSLFCIYERDYHLREIKIINKCIRLLKPIKRVII